MGRKERAEINVSELDIDADGAAFLITGLPGEEAKTVRLRPGEKFLWGPEYALGTPRQRREKVFMQRDGIELLFTGKAADGRYLACLSRYHRDFPAGSALTVGWPNSGGSFFWPVEEAA